MNDHAVTASLVSLFFVVLPAATVIAWLVFR
jgi:hypothetical protein